MAVFNETINTGEELRKIRANQQFKNKTILLTMNYLKTKTELLINLTSFYLHVFYFNQNQHRQRDPQWSENQASNVYERYSMDLLNPSSRPR